MRAKTYFLILAVLTAIASAGLPALAHDKEPVGLVVAVRGRAEAIDPQGCMRTLAMKSPVYLSDVLKTGPQGRIQVLFTDNTIISLGKASEMEVTEHIWNAGAGDGCMKTTVKEGVFRVMGGAIAKEAPRNFTTVTPAATIGIRGSMYAGRIDGGKLLVVFEGGKGIEVTNGAGMVAVTRPGFGTSIASAGAPPQKPRRFTASDLSDMNRDLAVDENEPGSETPTSPPQGEGRGDTEAAGEESSEADGSEGKSTGDEEARPGDAPAPPSGDEVASVSDDAGPGTSDDDGSIDLLTSTVPEAPVLPATTASVPPADTASVPGTLTDVTQSWQEPFTGSDTSLLPAATSLSLSGFHIGALVDSGNCLNPVNTFWYDTNSGGVSTNGSVNETPAAERNTFTDLALSMNPYNLQAVYAYPENWSITTRTLSLLGAERSFAMKIASDAKGEFAVYDVAGSFTQGQSFEYRELGFLGAPCTDALPTDGISGYFGPALGYEDLDIRKDYGTADMVMEVNWLNGKALGLLGFAGSDSGDPDPYLGGMESCLFFFGDVDRENRRLVNVRVLGPKGPSWEDDPTDPVAWIEGTGNAGFYGSEYQGFGITGSGSDYDIAGNMTDAVGTSRLVAAGFREIEEGVDETSPTGSQTFRGFVAGIAENMSDPATDRRIFMNENPDDFQFTLDKEAGTVNGSLSAVDVSNANRYLSSIEIGWSNGSAYILDDAFVALLGDYGDDAVTSDTATGGLKPKANYLITEDPDYQFSDYVTWGYWEIAYVDPLTSENCHVHFPGSVWVAGELSPGSAVQDMVTNNRVVTYTGGAHGVRIGVAGVMERLTGGTSSVTVDFDPAAGLPVSGTIGFNEQTLNLGSGLISPTSSRFSAGINGASSSNVQGAFFGPGANAIGGNFEADFSGTRYIGIFGGDRQ